MGNTQTQILSGDRPRNLNISEKAKWDNLIGQFKQLIGIEELEMRWKQGVIIDEMWRNWNGPALSWLSEETGFSIKQIQRIWRFYQVFSEKQWDSELSYELHAEIAWHVNLANLQNNELVTTGRTLREWIDFVKNNPLPLDRFSSVLGKYYGENLDSKSRLELGELIVITDGLAEVDVHPQIKQAAAAIYCEQNKKTHGQSKVIPIHSRVKSFGNSGIPTSLHARSKREEDNSNRYGVDNSKPVLKNFAVTIKFTLSVGNEGEAQAIVSQLLESKLIEKYASNVSKTIKEA